MKPQLGFAEIISDDLPIPHFAAYDAFNPV
jgi:hypothetical protein